MNERFEIKAVRLLQVTPMQFVQNALSFFVCIYLETDFCVSCDFRLDHFLLSLSVVIPVLFIVICRLLKQLRGFCSICISRGVFAVRAYYSLLPQHFSVKFSELNSIDFVQFSKDQARRIYEINEHRLFPIRFNKKENLYFIRVEYKYFGRFWMDNLKPICTESDVFEMIERLKLLEFLGAISVKRPFEDDDPGMYEIER